MIGRNGAGQKTRKALWRGYSGTFGGPVAGILGDLQDGRRGT